jgi:GTP cyclohydrolase FolE2
VERKGCTVKVSTREGEKYRKWEKYALAMGKYGGFATQNSVQVKCKGITSCPYSAEKTPGSYRKIVRGGGGI